MTVLVAKAFVIDAKEHCLVLQRSASHPYAAHMPDLPGGQIDDGESPIQAVMREIQEETGLVVSPGHLRMLFTKTTFDTARNTSFVRILFAVRLSAIKPMVTISWEHDGATWVPLSEVASRLTHPEYKNGLDYIITHHLFEELPRPGKPADA